jgi:hypothetical protein
MSPATPWNLGVTNLKEIVIRYSTGKLTALCCDFDQLVFNIKIILKCLI